MNNPLKAPRQVANDPRPLPSQSVNIPAVKTIKLTYRPVKKSSRAAGFFMLVMLCGLTGASAWYASKALALYVAAKAMVVDLSIPLPPPRPVVVHPVTQSAPSAPKQAGTTPAPQAIVPPPEITPQPVPAETHDEITLPVAPTASADKAADVPPAPTPTDVGQVTVTPPEMSEEQILDDAHTLFEGGDSKGALAAYDEALARDAINQAAMAGKAFVLARTRQFEASVAISHRLLKLYPHDNAARLNLIITLGRWSSPKAVEELQQIIAVNPENATAHMALGKQYERQGDFQHAIVELDTAAHQAPADLSYRLDLAILYDHAGYASQAVTLYRQVLQANAENRMATSVPIAADALEQRIEYLESLGEAKPSR
jgi:tetratricopeptide (TPR) repeat protein